MFACKSHRVAAFQDFGIGDAGVGHVRVHAGSAVPAGTRACAAAYSLVVPQIGVPKCQVVRAPLQSQVPHSFAANRCRVAFLRITVRCSGALCCNFTMQPTYTGDSANPAECW
jgi:hypothetical protein